jgi:hypothetical protein
MGRSTVGSCDHFPSQQDDVAGGGWCRCLRTRGGSEEVESSAEADEAGQRSLDQQVGLKSPNNTDSNAPLA